jgi:polyribonucleotide 5'-hydroxyl-kinase
MAPSSALPIGASRVVSELQPLLVDPSRSSSGLFNSVLALLSPPDTSESDTYDEQILDLHVTGFLFV